MEQVRDWCWQVRTLSQGPDAVFCANFAPTDAIRLGQRVQQHMPSSFVQGPETSELEPGGQVDVVYFDRHTRDRQLAMQASGKRENIWYYGEISVSGHRLFMHNVLLGHYPGQSELLCALAEAPELTLQEWRVCYDGYSRGEVAGGTDKASLLAYLLQA